MAHQIQTELFWWIDDCQGSICKILPAGIDRPMVEIEVKSGGEVRYGSLGTEFPEAEAFLLM